MIEDFAGRILYALFIFFILGIMFIPLERAFPFRVTQRVFRVGWRTDLLYFLGRYLIWGGITVFCLGKVRGWIDISELETIREVILTCPWWEQSILVLILGDFCNYWFHRFQHSNSWLWKFHKVHHSSIELDWLAAHREHPVDGFLTELAGNVPAFLLGFPIYTLAGVIVFRGLWAIFIHSNVRLPLGPLKYLLGAPELHHWHHARSTRAVNFANLSPLFDLLFGSYECPQSPPPELGTDEPLATGYVAQLISPWRDPYLKNRRSLKKNRTV